MKLDSSIKKALKWIHSHIEFFNPIEDIESIMANKIFIELHLMLFIFERNKDVINNDCKIIINDLNSFAEKILLSPKYYEQLLVKPQNFRINGFAMLFYLSYNKNKKLEDIVKRSYQTFIQISPEIIPYRKMDLEYCIQLGDRYLKRNIDEIKDMSFLAKDTILNTKIDLINYEYTDEYAITHTLFYLSDFGQKEI